MKSLEFLVFGLYGLCLAFIFLYSLVQLQLAILYIWGRKKIIKAPPIPEPTNWPKVTVQLPLYNEIYVAERLLDNIMALDYPADKLQIQVLDDSTDATTKLIADKIASDLRVGTNIKHIRRADRVGYKAGALQYGLAEATGEFICIFDADFLPNPDFLKKTIPAFNAPDVGVVQTRWGHLNQNYSVLTQLQAFGLNAHFTVEQSGRSAGNHFINFNGTAGVWRKSCISDAGGWQPDTLTEDLDLSYRAQLRNWQFRYLETVEAPAELPAAMPAIKSQQFRWTKGAAETARKNLINVLKSGQTTGTKINAFFHLLNSSVFVCVLLTALLSIPILILSSNAIYTAIWFTSNYLFIISLLALLLFYFISFRQLEPRRPFRNFYFLPKLFLFLSFSMGLSLHNSIAVLEGYWGKKSPFIRTPKYNILSGQDRWQKSLYTFKHIPLLTWLELILCLYFITGIFLGVYLNTYGFLPFHTMLALGYGGVFYYTVKHSR